MEKIVIGRTLEGGRYVSETLRFDKNTGVWAKINLPTAGDVKFQVSFDAVEWADLYGSLRSIESMAIFKLDDLCQSVFYRVSCSVNATSIVIKY